MLCNSEQVRLTITGHHGDVAEKIQNLGAQQWAIPYTQELVEKTLCAEETLLRKQNAIEDYI